jgi:hypothetical protein
MDKVLLDTFVDYSIKVIDVRMGGSLMYTPLL